MDLRITNNEGQYLFHHADEALYTANHLWTQEQITTSEYLAHILAVFLLKDRSRTPAN